MSRRASLFLVAFLPQLALGPGVAQVMPRSPAPSPMPTASATPAPPPTTDAIINSMAPADLQQVMQLLKSNYINPAALNEAELNRAMLSGVLERLGGGALLLPAQAAEAPASDAFYSEIIEGHVGYVRPGALTPANLQALDATLQKYAGKKIDAVVMDLRASRATNDFATAAEFAKRFVGRNKPLFTLRRAAGKQERAFASDRDPAYTGLVLVLADSETAGPAEALAGDLRLHNKALVIGQPTAGRAVEYSDLPLNGGRILRAAVSEAVLPEGAVLFPSGLKPDLPVEMALEDKRQIFAQSVPSGMAPFVFENERPHMNEAALIAGRNPELDALEASQRKKNAEKPAPPRDVILQRALDLVTSLAIYQKK